MKILCRHLHLLPSTPNVYSFTPAPSASQGARMPVVHPALSHRPSASGLPGAVAMRPSSVRLMNYSRLRTPPPPSPSPAPPIRERHSMRQCRQRANAVNAPISSMRQYRQCASAAQHANTAPVSLNGPQRNQSNPTRDLVVGEHREIRERGLDNLAYERTNPCGDQYSG